MPTADAQGLHLGQRLGDGLGLRALAAERGLDHVLVDRRGIDRHVDAGPDQEVAAGPAAGSEHDGAQGSSSPWRRWAMRAKISAAVSSIARRVTSITGQPLRSEEHTSEPQSIMRISYAVFCLNKK